MARLEAAINAAGMAVYARIDHGAAAAAVHLALRPTEVIIFGNPAGGTPLMQASQALAIDLPLKALVYQDALDQVWVAYNDPRWIAERHEVDAAGIPSVAAMTTALKKIVRQATSSDNGMNAVNPATTPGELMAARIAVAMDYFRKVDAADPHPDGPHDG